MLRETTNQNLMYGRALKLVYLCNAYNRQEALKIPDAIETKQGLI